jgi:glyoxylase-like metal-dependent hydrolase (beta-lactamase superfamily II)/rhodanese-related sulfurtransferase
MKIEQIYTGCIAQAAYYIENKGEVALFDPLREVQPYIDKANIDHAKIKYIFETHFHADFVSGHLDLANKTGGKIVFGPTAKPEFEAIVATDNQEFKVGDYTIKAIHTPGHTMESTCYLLIDQSGKEHGLITGDTLFIGDVGRPDLAQSLEKELTQEKLASYLFDSLRNKIMPLSDYLIVYPSHGAGSACGKNMSKETTDTLGNQKKTNYALRANMTKKEFTAEVLDGLGAPPAYFPQNVMMNIKGYASLDSVIDKSKKPLSPDEFNSIANETDAIILDVRHENDFVKCHIPRSIFIGIQGNFAPWVGSLIMNTKQAILLITPNGMENETITRLSRVGFDNVLGYLEGGIDAWKKSGYETDSIHSISPEQFSNEVNKQSIIVDARKPSEFEAEHVENAINLPLDTLNTHLDLVSKNENFFLHCAGGYRSVIMASILKSRGFHHFTNIEKGISGIRSTNVPLTHFVCPTTLK